MVVDAPSNEQRSYRHIKNSPGGNLGNFMRTLALPDAVEQWSLTSLREKLIKIGATIVRHGRYVTFQMPEVVTHRDLFADILRRIDRLRPLPAPA